MSAAKTKKPDQSDIMLAVIRGEYKVAVRYLGYGAPDIEVIEDGEELGYFDVKGGRVFFGEGVSVFDSVKSARAYVQKMFADIKGDGDVAEWLGDHPWLECSDKQRVSSLLAIEQCARARLDVAEKTAARFAESLNTTRAEWEAARDALNGVGGAPARAKKARPKPWKPR